MGVWVVLMLMGQVDGGVTPPPPPPVAPREADFPRVVRTPGQVVRGAIVFAKYFTVLLMPTLTTSGLGVTASFSAGLGLTY